MVSRNQFINKISELGYSYKTETKRSQLFRKAGTTHYVWVPKSSQVEDGLVRNALRQAGCDDGEIDGFMKSCKA